MGYTTYDFYQNKYYGDSIEESLFPKWEDRAAMKLDQLTYGHINDNTKEEFDEHIMLRYLKTGIQENSCWPEASIFSTKKNPYGPNHSACVPVF